MTSCSRSAGGRSPTTSRSARRPCSGAPSSSPHHDTAPVCRPARSGWQTSSSWAARVQVARSHSVVAITSSAARPRARCGSTTRTSHGRTASSRCATATSPSATSHPANPSRLDGEHLPPGGATLAPGAYLRVGSTTLLLRQRSMTGVRHGTRDGRVLVHVRPRFLSADEPVEIHTPEEPRRPDGHRLPLLASLAPLVLSGALALAMRSPVMLLFALMSPVILIGQWWSDRRHGRLSHRRRLRQHADTLDAVAGHLSRGPQRGDPPAEGRASRPLPPARARRPTRPTPLGAAAQRRRLVRAATRHGHPAVSDRSHRLPDGRAPRRGRGARARRPA